MANKSRIEAKRKTTMDFISTSSKVTGAISFNACSINYVLYRDPPIAYLHLKCKPIFGGLHVISIFRLGLTENFNLASKCCKPCKRVNARIICAFSPDGWIAKRNPEASASRTSQQFSRNNFFFIPFIKCIVNCARAYRWHRLLALYLNSALVWRKVRALWKYIELVLTNHGVRISLNI